MKDKYDKTPFDYAKELKDDEYVELLIKIFGDKKKLIFYYKNVLFVRKRFIYWYLNIANKKFNFLGNMMG